MTNEENDFIKSIGFGFDLDEVDPGDREILIVAIGAYLNGYWLGSGVKNQPRYHRYGSECVYYYDAISMTTDNLLGLRSALPDHLQSSVRLYKVAKRMVPEIVTMAIGNIEMGEMMKEES